MEPRTAVIDVLGMKIAVAFSCRWMNDAIATVWNQRAGWPRYTVKET